MASAVPSNFPTTSDIADIEQLLSVCVGSSIAPNICTCYRTSGPIWGQGCSCGRNQHSTRNTAGKYSTYDSQTTNPVFACCRFIVPSPEAASKSIQHRESDVCCSEFDSRHCRFRGWSGGQPGLPDTGAGYCRTISWCSCEFHPLIPCLHAVKHLRITGYG